MMENENQNAFPENNALQLSSMPHFCILNRDNFPDSVCNTDFRIIINYFFKQTFWISLLNGFPHDNHSQLLGKFPSSGYKTASRIKFWTFKWRKCQPDFTPEFQILKNLDNLTIIREQTGLNQEQSWLPDNILLNLSSKIQKVSWFTDYYPENGWFLDFRIQNGSVF